MDLIFCVTQIYMLTNIYKNEFKVIGKFWMYVTIENVGTSTWYAPFSLQQIITSFWYVHIN